MKKNKETIKKKYEEPRVLTLEEFDNLGIVYKRMISEKKNRLSRLKIQVKE